MTTTIDIGNEQLSLRIHPKGGEMTSLRSARWGELLWQAGEAWPRHAPLLFPIVGRLGGDRLRVGGREFPMSQHGFARDSLFERVEHGRALARFRLIDNEQSRHHYPFGFELQVSYLVRDNGVIIDALIRNPGDQPLPASFGHHPAFLWPLPGNDDASGHRLRFEQEENAAMRRLRGGLLLAESVASPIQGRELILKRDLFNQDALIFDQLRSRRLSYQGPAGPRIAMEFEDFPHLGIWSKDDAPFVCIEPWQGHASPEEFDGEFADKPGLLILPPHSERQLRLIIHID